MTTASSPLAVAVIGSGVAGLAASWLLQRRHGVTLYEQAARLGGHCNTVDVPDANGNPVAVDTGFIVYNTVNYPNLVALFHAARRRDPRRATCRSRSRSTAARLEYAGTDLAGLFAQPANLLRPRFWAMLRDIVRFYRAAPGAARRRRGRGADASAAYLDARRLFRAPSSTTICCRWGPRSGRATVADMRDYPRPGLHPLLREPRPVAAHRPAAMAHRDRRQPGLCRSAWRRPLAGRIRARAARCARCAGMARDGVLVEERGRPHRALRPCRDRGACRRGAGACWPTPSAEERRVLGRIPLCAQPRRPAFRREPDAAAAARLGELELYRPPRRAARRAVRHLLDEPAAAARLRGAISSSPSIPSREPRADRVMRSFAYDHPGFDAGGSARRSAQLWSLQGRAPHLVLRRLFRRRLPRGRAAVGPCRRRGAGRRAAAVVGRRTNSGRIVLRAAAPPGARPRHERLGALFRHGRASAPAPGAARARLSRVLAAARSRRACRRSRGGCGFCRTTASISSASTTATMARAAIGALRPYVEAPARARRHRARRRRASGCCAFPRVLGYVFNPLSIYFCHQPRRRACARSSTKCRTRSASSTRYLIPVSGRDGPSCSRAAPRNSMSRPSWRWRDAMSSASPRPASGSRSISGRATATARSCMRASKATRAPLDRRDARCAPSCAIR